jgi:hypothetical protein
MRAAAMTVAAAALLWPTLVSGQVAEAVAGTEDGTVRLAFELKPGVEICDRGVRVGGDRVRWRSYGPDGRRDDSGVCVTDVGEIDLEVRDGTVRDVDVVSPSDPRPADLHRDLGVVAAADAFDFLVGLAHGGATSGAAEDAIFPATLADVDDGWRALLDLSRDRSVQRGVRKNALFWVGQEAADAATEGLSEVALADDEEQDVRDAAIFALSQRPENQAIGSLIEIARSAEQAKSRRSAMFWLAQSEDERVVDFFEEILLGRNR